MKKADLFKMYERQLATLEHLAETTFKNCGGKMRAIEQAYGYTLGIIACNEKYYDEISKIWSAWHSKMILSK